MHDKRVLWGVFGGLQPYYDSAGFKGRESGKGVVAGEPGEPGWDGRMGG